MDLSICGFYDIIVLVVMKMEEKLLKRKNIRLKNYDYSECGAYFITICTKEKQKILSNIVGAIHESPEMNVELTRSGKIVDKYIQASKTRFDIEINHCVIMPNHVHLVIEIIPNDIRAIRESPLRSRSVVSQVVGFIKANSSKEFNKINPDIEMWQRGFYDHIIRNKRDYEEISKYIYENPMKWELDELYC